jgi:hypothetical protein
MFADLQLKSPILNPYIYDSTEDLIAGSSEFVIDPAEQEAEARNDRTQRTYWHPCQSKAFCSR